ncbi:hypothetical protein PCE1_004952 [Barthelona sp. PCE]
MNSFGHLEDGQEVIEFTLQCGNIVAKVLNYGCIVTYISFDGSPNLVLSYPDLDSYVKNRSIRLNTVVGRVANRIEDGTFELDGITYNLPINEESRNNNLHSGPIGFDQRVWTVVERKPHIIEFEYISVHMEGGFPHEVVAKVEYSIKGSNFGIAYRANSDKPTPIAMTNHIYFSLDCPVNEMEMEINASEYWKLNRRCLPHRLCSVESTVFDFREPRVIAPAREELLTTRGYDHCFVLDSSDSATIKGRNIQMSLTTDNPCLQVYTGNYLQDAGFDDHSAICLEAQIRPNDISSMVTDTYKTYTGFSFSYLKEIDS